MIGEILTGILAWIGGMTVMVTVAAVIWIEVVGNRQQATGNRRREVRNDHRRF